VLLALATAGFLASGAPVVAQIEGRAARLVDPRSGAQIARLEHGARVRAADIQGDFVLTRGGGKAVLWSAAGARLFSLAVPDAAPLEVAADGRGLALYDKGLWLIAVPSGARVQVFRDKHPAQLKLSRTLAAVRTAGGVLSLWNTVDRKLVSRRRGVAEVFALSPDGDLLAWTDPDGVHLGGVAGKENFVLGVGRAENLSWGAHFLAACGANLRIWNARARSLEVVLEAPGDCAVAPDGRAALAGGKLYPLPPPDAHTDSHGLLGAAFTPRGELVTYGSQGKIATWAVPPEEHANAWVKPVEPCGSGVLAVSGDGRTVAAAGQDAARILAFGPVGFEEKAHVGGAFFAVALTGDGRTLALSSPAALGAWGPDGAPRWKREQSACSLAGAPDGSVIAAGGSDGSLQLFDARTGEPGRAYPPLEGPVRALAFSPDGRLLAAGAGAPVVFVHAQEGGELTVVPLEVGSPPRAIAFSRKGRLAVGCEDGVVRLFDVATRTRLAALPPLGAPVSAVAFSPAQDWLASGNARFGGARLTPLVAP
jgi:WD40 repeat protein